ncbi:hypothetical protein Sdia_59070 [Streptomyces diastaticus subsp. diastaticus]|uniref:Uncharacterized protein n=2 Tax=Streptomyces TaxID=1883 RepID=A0ABQ1CXX1_STRDI|nr:hypothetical protein Sdia_59070 [Streptomyces diastaticus subsp. diastaticus]GGU18057.1 hypothetical protein GCM10015534_20990 [Streptomyces diastaticus subsp. diastaticus]
MERAKFRREMTTRWDERKLDTYIQYVTCVKEISRAAMAAGRARDQGTDPSEALWEMETSENKRSILFETFVLLGNDKAATAAHEVNRRTWELLRAARKPDSGAAALDVPLVEALNGLHQAARADLTTGRPASCR